ncbi:MAG: ABC transporter permease [Schleiferiaceae bacterium]|nr:ABC transporter permease [Schleiferiaceae bacterium]
MIAYALNKLKQTGLVLFGVASLVFFLFSILPGDPARMMLDQREDEEQMLAIRAKYGFDKPVLQQYLLFLNNLSPLSIHSADSLDFTFPAPAKYTGQKLFSAGANEIWLKTPYLGESFQRRGKPVTAIIRETLPNTAILAVASIALAMLIGIFVGILTALRRDTWFDRFWTVFGTLGMAVPSFFAAVVVSWIFGFLLGDITGLPMTGNLYELDDYGENLRIKWSHLILPAFTLGIRPLAVVIQLTRSSMLEVLEQDYIRTARAKGLPERIVIRRHALRNALNPVVTAISGWFASMLAGAVFVEYIFGWNGLGKEIVDALQQLDLPVVMGAVLLISFIFVIIQFLVDLAYAVLDPRLR